MQTSNSLHDRENATQRIEAFSDGIFAIENCLYFIAIIISLFNPNAALIVTIILALLYLLPPKKPQYE